MHEKQETVKTRRTRLVFQLDDGTTIVRLIRPAVRQNYVVERRWLKKPKEILIYGPVEISRDSVESFLRNIEKCGFLYDNGDCYINKNRILSVHREEEEIEIDVFHHQTWFKHWE